MKSLHIYGWRQFHTSSATGVNFIYHVTVFVRIYNEKKKECNTMRTNYFTGVHALQTLKRQTTDLKTEIVAFKEEMVRIAQEVSPSVSL